MKSENRRLCPVCGDPIIGRVDKKFCSDQCRNTFNNRRYKVQNEIVQRINRTLRRNYSILRTLNSGGKTKIKRSRLLQNGFDFSFFTGTYQTQKGDVYNLIYDQGYLVLSEEYVLLIEWKIN